MHWSWEEYLRTPRKVRKLCVTYASMQARAKAPDK